MFGVSVVIPASLPRTYWYPVAPKGASAGVAPELGRSRQGATLDDAVRSLAPPHRFVGDVEELRTRFRPARGASSSSSSTSKATRCPFE